MEAAPDYEFEALREARGYQRALCGEFSPWLQGEVLEVGAGIGLMTQHLRALPRVTRLVALEPEARYCEHLRTALPGLDLIQGTSQDLPANARWDAVFSVNVLEHIEDDEAELRRYAGWLAPRGGTLCLFVPARPELYAPIDRDFGHWRRYTRPGLKRKLTAAGFSPVRLHYFNSLGYMAWWLNFCLLKRRRFERAKIVLFDRVLFPIVHACESRICRPPLGQSLLAVARAGARPGI